MAFVSGSEKAAVPLYVSTPKYLFINFNINLVYHIIHGLVEAPCPPHW